MALIDPLNALCLAAGMEEESGYPSRAIDLEVYLKVLNLREEILVRLGIECVGQIAVSGQNKIVPLASHRRFLVGEFVSAGVSVQQLRIDGGLDALLRGREVFAALGKRWSRR